EAKTYCNDREELGQIYHRPISQSSTCGEDEVCATGTVTHKINLDAALPMKTICRFGALVLLTRGCSFAQASPPEHFEVASIKHSAQTMGRFSGGPGSNDPERVTYESASLELLIREAYHLEPYQVSGPSWLRTEFYTVTAKEPPGTTL